MNEPICAVFGGQYVEAQFHLYLQLFAEKKRQVSGSGAAFVAMTVVRIVQESYCQQVVLQSREDPVADDQP